MTSVLHYRDPIAYRSGDLMSSINYAPSHMASMKKSPPYEDHSSGSEKRQTTPGSKKRPSRAGTRSVTTLTAAQLERKRANDREAQRAIRQRTKDHIETLERQVRDLTAQIDTNSSTKTMELMRRVEELENENAVLRTRLSHAVAALGVSESGGSAPSPSDRIQMLSQPRRSSTGTARSVHSVPEITTTSVSQPQHWPQQHTYAPDVPSPHIENPPPTWSPHPSSHQSHQAASMPVQDPSMHAVESGNMSYPSPYGLDNNSRAMSYPLENTSLVTSQPMQMSGYGTPTSNPSPHPSEYQRHMSVPMNPPAQVPHPQHQHPQQHHPYPGPGHQQQYMPQASHPQEMQMMAPAHPQPHMMNEQGQMMYHIQPNMKVEH